MKYALFLCLSLFLFEANSFGENHTKWSLKGAEERI